jgi:putative ABC transport system permease protein
MWSHIKLALESVRTNRLRSALTALGIFIGVFTLIVMVGLISGVNSSISSIINEELGTDTFWIGKVFDGNGRDRDEVQRLQRERKELQLADAEAIRACDLVQEAAPYWGLYRPIERGGEKTRRCEIIGTTQAYMDVVRLELATGRTWTDDEAERRRPVAILGQTIVTKLFPEGDPIGKEVRIEGQPYKVIGTLKQRGKKLGNDPNLKALIPASAAQKDFGRRLESWIVVKVGSPRILEESQDQAIQVLRARRGVPVDEDNDFDLVAADRFTQMFRDMTSGIAAGLTFIASIALFVGGIGIMNIMMVSVTERTREIGVRKAIGARRSEILRQFLIEAVVLTCIGGLAGFAVAAGVVTLIGKTTPFPATVPLWAPVLGLGICSAVGLGFGLFPAIKASALDPVESLRYE